MLRREEGTAITTTSRWKTVFSSNGGYLGFSPVSSEFQYINHTLWAQSLENQPLGHLPLLRFRIKARETSEERS